MLPLPALTTILVPLALIGTTIRLLLMPAFLEIEYRTPGFPRDQYGFSQDERLQYGKVTVRYLVSNDSIEFFNTQRLPNGAQLYNNLELAHMTDVKNLITWALRVWVCSLILLLFLLLTAWRRGWIDYYKRAVQRGAWLTLALITTITVFSAVAFGPFFDYFHTLLFSPGTWTFYESDTFIRLFPERFWQDIFLWTGCIVALLALALLWAVKKGGSKPPHTISKNRID